jgi:hypothetical protein
MVSNTEQLEKWPATHTPNLLDGMTSKVTGNSDDRNKLS